jgi:hypothetical protein
LAGGRGTKVSWLLLFYPATRNADEPGRTVCRYALPTTAPPEKPLNKKIKKNAAHLMTFSNYRDTGVNATTTTRKNIAT